MTPDQLAEELRERQYAAAQVERYLIDRLSDDEIIDCYITCSCCGAKQVEGERLRIAITQAVSADDFFALCNQLAGSHSHS